MPASEPGRPTAGLWLVGGGLGLLAAFVLTVDRFRLLADPNTKLSCNLSPFIDCGTVMESTAGEIFGFPNPLLGLVGFSVVITTAVVIMAGVRLPSWYHRGLVVGVLAAAVLITFLQTQSLYVIGALCLWCLLVWTVVIPITVTVVAHAAAAGHLGRALTGFGRGLRRFTPSVIAVWYAVVLVAVALRFYREFALFWFGIAV